jgi:TolB protein
VVKRSMLVVVTASLLLAPVVVTGPVQAEVRGANGQIAFERLRPGAIDAPGQGTVFVANPDGTHAQQVPLVYPTDVDAPIDWSPDGTKLLISHTVRFDSSGNCCLPFRPAIVNPDGSDFELLTMEWAPFDMACPVWTTDQTRLLCGTGEDPIGIFSVRASGGDPRRLTTYPFSPNCNACDTPTDVSPDGTRFVFLRFFRENGPGQQQVAIYVEKLDGTGLRQLTPYGYAAPHEAASAQWSPDGTRIISETTTGHLFTVRPDGGGLSQIRLQVGRANYFAFHPHWSPDGTRIIFAMFINGTEGLYTANPDGSNVVRVTDAPTGFDDAPDWGTHPLA